jgi:hypothetical protein
VRIRRVNDVPTLSVGGLLSNAVAGGVIGVVVREVFDRVALLPSRSVGVPDPVLSNRSHCRIFSCGPRRTAVTFQRRRTMPGHGGR